MDSYPPEFVIHLQPTLVVTGLTTEDASQHEPNQDHSTDSPPPPPPRPGTQPQNLSGLEAQKSALLRAMLSRNNITYWDNTKGLAGSLFYVVPEQRGYTLPPTQKSLYQSNQQHLFPSLSPSSPSSTLFPDGLVTPSWIRRHREQLPSVFIAIVDLWDRESSAGQSAKDGTGARNYSEKGPLGVIDPMERDNDTVLAQELLERRKAAQERNIKFAAVIMLQRSHMEDPSIEDRLNFVRKSAGLDIKNSFYVLPPSSLQEISDFAVNLQRSQYEGSMNYYKEQVKRHKKKKSNLPSTTASVRPPQQQLAGGAQNLGSQQQQQQNQGLSVQGWMLRYEFKMGVFSECKQDIDSAVKYYESAYGLLIDMFAVTSTITPGASGLQARTRRWAEAKVLADCLCLKICKFHLYLDAPSTALFHFRRHLLAFKAFSTNWRMGDDSFEYWAWLGKQYRVFGDLLDIGTKSGFKLPVPTPSSVVYGSFAGMTEGAKDLNKFSGIGTGGGNTGFGITPGGDAYVYGGHVGGGRGGGTHGPGAGINPMLVLQHAGYFYHQAANCSVQRRLRFELAEEAYPDSSVAPIPTANKPYPPSLQSMNAERNIDHLALTIELLTKAYEQFKRYKAGRMTLFLASEIAGTYYTAGKFEMALKFFERIGKTYRKEGWNLILTSILKWSVQCARELGYWENVVEYMIEMLSSDMPSTAEKRQSVADELLGILHTSTHPANAITHSPVVLLMNQMNSFVSCEVQFEKQQAFVSSSSRFQVQLSTEGGQGALPQAFRVSFIQLEFSDSSLNHRFEDPRPFAQKDEAGGSAKGIVFQDRTGRRIEWNDCTQTELRVLDKAASSDRADQAEEQKNWCQDVNLDIFPHATKVLEGIVIPKNQQSLQILKVTLGIVTEHWNLSLVYPFVDSAQGVSVGSPQHVQQQQLQYLPSPGAPPRRKWLSVMESTRDSGSAIKLSFRNLDMGARRQPVLRIVPRESKVEIKTTLKSPAYLDEFFPVVVWVKNGETCPVQIEMDVELQPIDPSIESQDTVVLDPHAVARATSLGQDNSPTQILKAIPLTATKGRGDAAAAKVEDVAVGAWAKQIVYVKATSIPTPRTIVCTVRYEVASESGGAKSLTEKQHSFRVLFIPPFDAEVDYIPQPALSSSVAAADSTTHDLVPILGSNTLDPVHGTILIPALTHREMYLMSTRINNEGPWPVQVKEVRLVMASEMEATPAAVAGGSKAGHELGGLARSQSVGRLRERKKSLMEVGIHARLVETGKNAKEQQQPQEGDQDSKVEEWRSGNLVTFNHLVEVTAVDLELAPEQVDIGYLQITWRRFEEKEDLRMPFTRTILPLQPLSLPKAEVFMTVDLPKYAQVNHPFTARYLIQNPTAKLQELAMTVEPSEGMVYAGTMQSTLKVLPYSTHPFQMSCFPLLAGLVRLPRVKLVVNKRKVGGRRAKAPPQPMQQQLQQQQQQGEETIVRVRGAVKMGGSTSNVRPVPGTAAPTAEEAVVIFVKPETGTTEE